MTAKLLTIGLVVASLVGYQLAQRTMPTGANPFTVVAIAYFLGIIACTPGARRREADRTRRCCVIEAMANLGARPVGRRHRDWLPAGVSRRLAARHHHRGHVYLDDGPACLDRCHFFFREYLAAPRRRPCSGDGRRVATGCPNACTVRELFPQAVSKNQMTRWQHDQHH